MFTLLKNARIYAPKMLGKQDILICQGQIVALDPDLQVNGLPDLQIYDLSGKYLCPGLVDGHAHLIGGGGEGGFATRTPEVQLSQLIKAGITTIVGLLGTDRNSRHVGSLYAKTQALRTEGISAYMLTGSYAFPSPTVTEGVEQDIIYLEPVIGVKTAIADHRASHLSDPELTRLASQARLGGMLSGKAGKIIVHIGGGTAGLSQLERVLAQSDLLRQQFLPTHVNRNQRLFDQSIAWMQAGGHIDLTAGINPEKGAKGGIKVSDILADLVASGCDGQYCVSSDGNGSLPKFDENGQMTGLTVADFDVLLAEIQDTLQRTDLCLSQILPAFTSHPARCLGLKQKGQIALGYDADFLVLDQDLSLSGVIASGKKMMWDYQICEFGTFENI